MVADRGIAKAVRADPFKARARAAEARRADISEAPSVLDSYGDFRDQSAHT